MKNPKETMVKLLSEYGSMAIMDLIRHMRGYGVREAETRLVISDLVGKNQAQFSPEGRVKLR